MVKLDRIIDCYHQRKAQIFGSMVPDGYRLDIVSSRVLVDLIRYFGGSAEPWPCRSEVTTVAAMERMIYDEECDDEYHVASDRVCVSVTHPESVLIDAAISQLEDQSKGVVLQATIVVPKDAFTDDIEFAFDSLAFRYTLTEGQDFRGSKEWGHAGGLYLYFIDRI